MLDLVFVIIAMISYLVSIFTKKYDTIGVYAAILHLVSFVALFLVIFTNTVSVSLKP